jgi:hypothetical protein
MAYFRNTCLQPLNQLPNPRTVEDAQLKQNFFEFFLPEAMHPTTGERVKLYPYQRRALEAFFDYQVNLWELGRQTGKTSESGLILAFLSRQIRGDAIVASFRMERSMEIIKWTRDWCFAHRDRSYSDNIINDAKTDAQFLTGFRVIALPHGQTSRGYTTKVVITDESQLMDDEDLSALLPTGLTTRPKRLHMGTVWGTSGWFYRFCRNADQCHYYLAHTTSEDAIAPGGPILQDQLALLKLELGEPQYNQECRLIAIPDVDVLFGLELTKSCLVDTPLTPIPKGVPVIIGFDHAVSGMDESVAHVCALQPNGILREVETRVWMNTVVHEQAQELARLYPNAYYCIDATAEAGPEALGTFRRAGLDVLGVDFGKSKPTLMITLKNTMQQHLYQFCDEKLQAQLGYYKFEQSKTQKGHYRYGQPGIPDDRVDAAALAAYRAYLMRGYAGESNIAFVGDQIRVNETSGTEFM